MYTFVNSDGEYYKSKRPMAPGDIRVPDRPSGEHYWVDGSWVLRGDREKWLDEHVRPKRDSLLKETMWIAEKQSTAPTKQKMPSDLYDKWITYWQALRDLPGTIDVKDPQFPDMPELKLDKKKEDDDD